MHGKGIRRRWLLWVAVCVLGLGGSQAALGWWAEGAPAAAVANLTITIQNTRFGTQRYSLRCNPAGGTTPEPDAACMVLSRTPQMLVTPTERGSPCPDSGAVLVVGVYGQRHVDARFTSSCRIPRRSDQLSTSWLSLFPDGRKVRLDLGVGPLSLGDSRSEAEAILGKGEQGPSGLTVYRGHYRTRRGRRLQSLYAIGYDRAGAIRTLMSFSPELTVDGHYVEHAVPEAREPEIPSLLARWRKVRCGTLSLRIDRSFSGSPVTALGVIPGGSRSEEKAVVIISTRLRRACLSASDLIRRQHR
jgi:hypothetical protein